MALEEVGAKIEGGTPVSVNFDFGGTLQEAIGLFGEDLVYNKFVAAARIDLQSFMRGMIRTEKNQQEMDAAVAEWRPGMKARGKSPQEKIKAILAKFDPEEAKAIIEAALLAGEDEEDEDVA